MQVKTKVTRSSNGSADLRLTPEDVAKTGVTHVTVHMTGNAKAYAVDSEHTITVVHEPPKKDKKEK